jgi:hypothetical protein
MQNESFEKYVFNLKREDSSIWKPIKNRRKPKTSRPIRKYSSPPGPWAKSDKEKAEVFADQLNKVFSPHKNYQDQEVEQDHLHPFNNKDVLKHLL